MTCIVPPVIIMALSVSNKILYPDGIGDINYLNTRFFLISSSIIPLIIIQLRETKLLVCSLLVSGLFLIFFDPILSLFHVGYEDLVGDGTRYYRTANFYGIAPYFFILFSLLFEKRLSEKNADQNEKLILFLNKANKNSDQQTEKLLTKQEELIRANKIIEEQKEALLKIQLGLQSELSMRHKELMQTNEELAKYNHELQQFSYSVSHNLRGPLARLLGLTNLLEKDLDGLKDAQLELVKLISRSSKELDEVIRDLGKIIDLKNDVYRIREKVFFQEEWSNVLRSLSSFIHSDIHIETDFRQAPVLYTVRPILTSILYNLVSNAIKYRSAERDPLIKIKTSTQDGFTILEITDNGLGMTPEQCQSVFGLYKRFHSHTEGKGIGLYLVKLQIESLGGTVNVHSELNVGTTFTIKFKTPSNIEGQVVFENDFGTVFFNARHHCSGIIWKKQVTSEQYRLIFTKCAEIVRIYSSVFWFADIRQQGTVQYNDQQWLTTQIFPEAIRYGLRKAVLIYSEEQHNENYRALLIETFGKYNIEAKLFTTQSEAEEWMSSVNRWSPQDTIQ